MDLRPERDPVDHILQVVGSDLIVRFVDQRSTHGFDDVRPERSAFQSGCIGHQDLEIAFLQRLDVFVRGGVGDDDLIGQICGELETLLAQAGLRAALSGREKRPYSIWQKMQHQNVEFAHLSDIMAFRVVVDSVEDCYRALGVIHARYRCVPGRFKDYISNPKQNDYQSIHTNEQLFERTAAPGDDMHIEDPRAWAARSGRAERTLVVDAQRPL